MKKSHLRRGFIFLSLLLLLVLSNGCRRNAKTSDLSTRNSVVWWIASDITRLHPWVSHDADAPYVSSNIWEPLNSTDAHTQELIPWLASLPEVSEDHLTYTYTMDPAAKWSDGQPLTGDDVVFSFKAVLNPALIDATPLRNYLNSLDSIEFVGGDHNKVAFHMNKPYFLTDRVLGGGYVVILPEHIFDKDRLLRGVNFKTLKSGKATAPGLQKWADWFEGGSVARDPQYQIGSGPYLYNEWVTSDHIKLTKNPNYWAKDKPWGEVYVDELIFKTISDQNAAFTALKARQIDIMPNIATPDFVKLNQKDYPSIRKDTVFINQWAFIGWNNQNVLFKNRLTRRALTHAINREEIIHNILKDVARPIDGPIIFTQPNYVPDPNPLAFNVDSAKILLRQAGWVDSDGDGILDSTINGKKVPFRFTFSITSGGETLKQITLVMAEQLKKVGIAADITQLEWSVLLENLHSHNYDATIAGLAGNSGEDDPFQTWHSSQASNKGSNWYQFKNSEVDAILERNRSELDKTKRMENYRRFLAIVRDQQPITFLWASPLRLARIDRFSNVELFHQRPGFNPQYWIVNGSGQKAKEGSPSTVQQERQPVP